VVKKLGGGGFIEGKSLVSQVAPGTFKIKLFYDNASQWWHSGITLA
jgi:hypothetical protein